MTPLRAARLRKGLSLPQVASYAGIRVSYLSKIERGRVPSQDTARRIARLLGLRLEDFLFNTRRKPDSGGRRPCAREGAPGSAGAPGAEG